MIIQLKEHWRIKNRKNIIFKNLKTTPNIENWNIGILEYWNIGILEYWNIGILEYWKIGILKIS